MRADRILLTRTCLCYNMYYILCSDCTHGEVRLVGGSKPQEGRVEICIDQAWATICDRYFEVNDAEILCSQLGYSKLGLLCAWS